MNSESEQVEGETQQCTVHTCSKKATRVLRWPDPGGLTAEFCDRHADRKLAITKTEEVTNDC